MVIGTWVVSYDMMVALEMGCVHMAVDFLCFCFSTNNDSHRLLRNVGMLKALHGRRPLAWIECEHFLDHVVGKITQLRAQFARFSG